MKHGLLSEGVTEIDDSEGYQARLHDLMREKKPIGLTETFLVKSIALDMLRWERARQLEGSFIRSVLNPPVIRDPFSIEALSGPKVEDPGLPALIDAENAQKLVSTFQRYESMFATRFLRLMHELERLQRTRNGEQLPAPAILDVTIQADDKSSQ